MIQGTRTHRSSLKYGPLWIIAVMLIAGLADAAGYGGYVGYARSKGEVGVSGFGQNIDIDHERDAVEFGFVLDTNLAKDRVFNYRLRIGLLAGEREYSRNTFPISSTKEKTFGIAVENTFGFGVLRTQNVRLWIGPTIRFSFDGCTNCDNPDYDSTFIGIGAGPEIGLNINIGDHLTLSPTLGYKYMYGANNLETNTFEDTRHGDQHQVSLLFQIFFRTASDNFEGK